jgi:epoxyqueuosine reductase QueG
MESEGSRDSRPGVGGARGAGEPGAGKFNGSPVRRAGFLGLKRNVAIAMGNSGLSRFAPWLEKWSEAADEGLRTAARWALEKLKNNR